MGKRRKLKVDCFAGGGGASKGIERGSGDDVDVAINHSRAAVAMHRANHPRTRHFCQDIWEVDPLEATGGRPVGLAWFSPDCTHFSQAKGAQPVKKSIRSLAGVVIKWAKLTRPDVIILENVREFEGWGPLVPMRDGNGEVLSWPDGSPKMKPCPERKGRTFQAWVHALRMLGYAVEWRSLNAADFGAPTHRRRLFLIARCDGRPIRWPEPTHGAGLLAYRTAAGCIDWSLPCPSIFLTRDEVKRLGLRCKRPLAANTERRIAMGLRKFVLDAPEPFIVRCDHGGDHFRGQAVDRPLSTVTGHHGFGLTMPFFTSYYGEGKHQDTRGNRVDEPLRTQTAENRFGLVLPFLAKHYGGVVGHGPDRPLGTITTVDHHSVVAACLIKNNHGDKQWFDVAEPLRTICAGGNHHALVLAFLMKYYGRGDGQGLGEPLHTVTAGDHFALVTVAGARWALADIGLRMLKAFELFRCQGFPPDYVIDVELDGRPLSAEAQVELCGNSVCPDVAEAVVRANVGSGKGVICA